MQIEFYNFTSVCSTRGWGAWLLEKLVSFLSWKNLTQKLGSADFVKKIKFSAVFVEQRVSLDKFKQPRGANTSVFYLDKGSWRSTLVTAKSLKRESKIVYGKWNSDNVWKNGKKWRKRSLILVQSCCSFILLHLCSSDVLLAINIVVAT